MEDKWENPYEEDGVTLGPEEALLRETEKTKVLKVEKLQLKDTIEKLKSKNDALTNISNSLKQKNSHRSIRKMFCHSATVYLPLGSNPSIQLRPPS